MAKEGGSGGFLGGLFRGKGLRRFHQTEVIAEGTMSLIRKVIDTTTGETRVLKLYNHAGRIMRRAIERKYPDIIERLTAIDHPNILRTYEMGVEGRQRYAVLGFVEGATWAKLAPSKLTDYGWWIGKIVQLAEAIRAFHEDWGLVHRDINPANIMVDSNGHCTVVDLDFAFLRGDTAEGTYRRSGTLGYMAPEQVRGQKLDERVDIYAFGVTVYEALVHSNPYRGRASGRDPEARQDRVLAQHLQLLPASPRELGVKVPAELDELVMRCLQIRREDRWHTMSEIVPILAKLLQEHEDARGTRGKPARW